MEDKAASAMDDLKELKENIRLRVRKLRDEISDEEVLERSREIFRKITSTEAYRKAASVFVYVSFDHEVSTPAFIEKAWQDGKKVAVPRTEAHRQMSFWYIRSFDDLKRSKYGILEPDPARHDLICADQAEHVLMIMPGVAFDTSCHRIGYGGSYYDRYLKKHRSITRCAVAFDFQISDSVPYTFMDVPPEAIFTEKRVIGSDRFRQPAVTG